MDNFINLRVNYTHQPPSPFSFCYSILFCFSFISLIYFSLFHFFTLSLFFFFFKVADGLVILKLRSATFFWTKKYILYLDVCSYFRKTKKNQEIVNSEISSKTSILQTSKKSTKLPILQTSKNRRNCWKKNCSKFFDKLIFFNLFQVFLRKCL